VVTARKKINTVIQVVVEIKVGIEGGAVEADEAVEAVEAVEAAEAIKVADRVVGAAGETEGCHSMLMLVSQ